MRSHWRSRAATERHETRSLSAGTINKREQFHKGNKDMDVLCSVDPAARSCIDRQHLSVCLCGRIGRRFNLLPICRRGEGWRRSHYQTHTHTHTHTLTKGDVCTLNARSQFLPHSEHCRSHHKNTKEIAICRLCEGRRQRSLC